VWVGERLTYTLSLTHTSLITATQAVITDELPAHAAFAYASDGGALTDNVVTWMVPELAPTQTLNLTLSITATNVLSGTPLVNAVYGVRSDQTPEPTWGQPVTVTAWSFTVYLPVVLR
jgi:uncharacterized repeat protein (TIGR01451 family)